MQTITINVEDSKIDNVVTLLQELKESLIESYTIEPQKDKNLELDPYYYERKKRLTKLREDIAFDRMPLHDFDSSIDALIKELEA